MLLAELVGLAVAAIVITAVSPLAWLAVGAVAIPVLARIGRPESKPIINSAIVLSMEIIIRAQTSTSRTV